MKMKYLSNLKKKILLQLILLQLLYILFQGISDKSNALTCLLKVPMLQGSRYKYLYLFAIVGPCTKIVFSRYLVLALGMKYNCDCLVSLDLQFLLIVKQSWNI